MKIPAFVDRLPLRLREPVRFLIHHDNAVVFVVGFVFDMVTIQRIDSWLDLAIQFCYMVILTLLLVYQYREHRGTWAPNPKFAKIWSFNVEALHFFYGGLLSSYVVLYFKSSTGARSVVFFLVLVVLLFVNEMPQIRRVGYRLRLGLYAFCVVSFLTFFFPIVIGRMGGWIFALAVMTAAFVVWRVAGLLANHDTEPRPAQRRLFAPAAALLTLISVLYVLKLIPPVPLSVQFQGVYHNIERVGGAYTLTYEKPPFYAFWRRDSRPFHRRTGDRLCYFARVFAPSRFHHEITIRWDIFDERRGEWLTSDRMAMAISGGRAEGFRGVATKDNFTAGKWRVTSETEDGRAISVLHFTVEDDPGTGERPWNSSKA